MERQAQGIRGGFTGKPGAVTVGSWKGISYMRTRSLARKNRKRTQRQIEQQAKFGLAIKFIRAMNFLLDASYQESSGKTVKNVALSQILAQSIGGVYPDLYIDYPTVAVAKGSLKKPDNPAVAAGAQGTLNFTWMDTSGLGNSTADDKAILVAYCPEIGEFMYNVNAATRSQSADSLDVRFFSGKQVHTWMAFRSADGKYSSDSIYTGTVNVL